MTSLDVNQAVALLQKSNEVSGGSVYDHLTELVGKVSAIAGHEMLTGTPSCGANPSGFPDAEPDPQAT